MLTQEQRLYKLHNFEPLLKFVIKLWLNQHTRVRQKWEIWAFARSADHLVLYIFSWRFHFGCKSHRCSCSLPVCLSVALPLSLFLSLPVTRHLSRHFSWMEICSSSLQTGRLCERMQSLGDGLSGSVYWHALIWHWVKGMSHRLQTHYHHITATPANREAAPGIQVELHQRSLIQPPRATCSNKPCLHCWMEGWWSFSKGMCAGAWICNTHKNAHTVPCTHKKHKLHTVLQTPPAPKHNICVHQLLKLTHCTLSHKSGLLLLKSGVDAWAWCQIAYHRKGLFI